MYGGVICALASLCAVVEAASKHAVNKQRRKTSYVILRVAQFCACRMVLGVSKILEGSRVRRSGVEVKVSIYHQTYPSLTSPHSNDSLNDFMNAAKNNASWGIPNEVEFAKRRCDRENQHRDR